MMQTMTMTFLKSRPYNGPHTRNTKQAILAGAIALSALAYTPVLAETSDYEPGRLPIFAQPRALDTTTPEPVSPLPAELVAPVPTQSVSDEQIVVAKLEDVVFYGPSVVSRQELSEIVRPYLAKPMTRNDLAMLKYQVNKSFHDKGYILVRAVTIPQDVSDGVLRIDVHEGKVGKVETVNNAVHDYIADSRLDRMETGTVINEAALESMVTDLNDLSGVQANVSLRPGAKFGTSDLVVNIEEADEDVNYISIDNYGSELTGEHVATLHLEKSNVLGMGERFYTDLRHSDEDLYSVAAGAEIPTGLGNTVLEVSGNYSSNEIGDRLAALAAEGESYSGNVALSGKVINTRRHSVTLRAGMEARHHESTLAGFPSSEDDIRKAYAQAEYLHKGQNTVIYAGATISRNIDGLGATEDNDPLKSRAQGSNEVWAFRPTLYVSHRPWEDGEMRLYSTAQLASNAMLSSDLFILGGYGSVRGFPLAQETGENGYLVNAEYLHTLLQGEYGRVAVGPFFDGGHVYNKVSGSSVDSSLYSAGLGVEATGTFIPLGDTRARLDWAHALGDYDSPLIDDNEFYFRVTQEF